MRMRSLWAASLERLDRRLGTRPAPDAAGGRRARSWTFTRAINALTFCGFLVVCTAATPSVVGAQDDVQARMLAWSKDLGVECTHCHTVDQWTDSSKPSFEFAQRMNRMQAALNGLLKDVGEISCWTCHRGRPFTLRDTAL